MQRSLNAVVALLTAWLAFSLAGCAQEKSPDAGRRTASDYFPIKVDGKVVRMQLAVLDLEQERGLMYRRDLGRDDGMLFVYPHSRRVGFWMRNTPTPLDIGFFDEEGVLQEIYPLQPFDERPVNSRSDRIKFPLEMNQGWFAEAGLRPGARLDLKALAEALKARGFEPRRFGLE